MKKTSLLIPLLLPCLVFSQTNKPKVSPVHAGSFSNNKVSYVVGKIYVLPPPVLNKDNKEQNKTTNNLKVFPNPVTNIVRVETLDKSNVKFIEVADMTGKVLYSGILENNTIDLSFLKQGFYTLKFDNDSRKTFKIIKN